MRLRSGPENAAETGSRATLDLLMQPGGERDPAERTSTMLDVIYLLVGAAFLGACVLYSIACDHL